jgi:hypothetical protein
MADAPLPATDAKAPAARADRRWALLVLTAVVVIPVVLVAAGLTPIPLGQREAMLPWSLDGRVSADGRAWDALWWDGVAQFLSWRWVLGDALRHGEVPLWSPWSFCGQPFAANGQSACFYPPAMLCCWLLPAASAIAALWAFHVALAALLTGLLARRLGMSYLAGAAAGAVFATGGFLLAWAPVQSLMMSAAWLPGALLGIELALHDRRAGGAFVLALSLAMAVLAGHMQVAGYVWLTAAAWASTRLVFRAARGKPWPSAPVAAGFALALALSAYQWLPTAELGRLSPRGGEGPTPAGFAFAQQLALKPWHLATLAWPSALGLPRTGDYPGFAFAEHFLGLGPLTAALALLGLARGRRKWAIGLGATALVSLFVAMGTPLAALIYYHVPVLGLTAGFQRVTFVFCLAWALLAGIGLDRLLRGPTPATPAAAAPGDRRGRSILAGVASALLIAQAAWLLWLVLPMSRAALAGRPTQVTNWLQSHADSQSRFLAVTPRAAWTLKPRPAALLPPNTAAVYGLRDVEGYDSLYLRAYKAAAARWEGADPAPPANGNMVLLENVDAPELGALGVRYVVTGGPVGSPRLRKVAEFGPASGAPGTVCIYEREDCLPRARLRRVGAEPLSPEVTTVSVAQERLGYVRLDIPPGSGGTLEVAETPCPGWRAYLNAEPVPWATAPGHRLVRTVSVSGAKGKQSVQFAFWPATVVLGGFLSLVAALLLAALRVLSWRPVCRPAACLPPTSAVR